MIPVYRLRLLLPDLSFGLAEAVAVLWPVHVFFTLSRRLLILGALVFLVTSLVWGAVQHRWLLPVDRLARGLPAQQAGRRATLRLCWRSLWLRVVLVLLGSGVFGLIAVLRLGYPPQALPVALWSAAISTPLLDSFRALLFERLLRDMMQGPGEKQALEYMEATLVPRLALVALCTGAPAMATVLAVARFFVPLSPAQALNLGVYYPPVPLALLGLWGAWLYVSTGPLVTYLRRPGDPAAADPVRVYRTAQLLPYLLGLSKVVLWALAALAWWLIGTRLWQIDAESNLLLLGLTVLVTLGAALYEVLWHRALLAPLLTHLLSPSATALRGTPPVRAPLSLRTKMLLSFGALTIFACGLSLFWSAITYRNLATQYTRWLNRGRIGDIAAELRDEPQLPSTTLAPLLQRHARDEVLVYYVGPDRQRYRFAPPGGQAPPELPREAWAALGRRDKGDLDLPAQRLSASYAPLTGALGVDLGAVLVAQPSREDRALDTEARILIVFFISLLSGSIGVVVLTAADLTRPLRELEQRAGSVRRGELLRPGAGVIVEGDEVGRLYEAFEEMRLALSERFRSSTEVHFALEAQVARRTAELERRNRELQEALSALRRAQAELLAAEKMASMGRLVAGIAHEINNPVNAVVNTAGPLAESLAELEELLSREREDGALRAALQAAVEDMRDMLRVVQRGARRTKEIVQALHNYSRGDGGLPEPVDVHRCLDESLDLLHHYLKEGITVHRDYGALPQVLGYSGQLQQVFMNLLTNAAQALGSAQAAQQPEIRITTRVTQPDREAPQAPRSFDREAPQAPRSFDREAPQAPRSFDREAPQAPRSLDRVLVRIADNGPGIPEALLPRIFDPFFTTKDVGQGSGLGLSIVHSIVERHGGTIAVETALGQGTAFLVSLPVAGPGAASA